MNVWDERDGVYDKYAGGAGETVTVHQGNEPCASDVRIGTSTNWRLRVGPRCQTRAFDLPTPEALALLNDEQSRCNQPRTRSDTTLHSAQCTNMRLEDHNSRQGRNGDAAEMRQERTTMATAMGNG